MVADYYERLGVEPTATTAEIEAALKKRQPAWSMGTRNPKTRHANQLYLDEIPALRGALLGSPEARAIYDAELAAAREAARAERLDELQRLIRVRAAKGGLSPADRELLRDEAVRLGLEAGDLDSLARTVPVWMDDGFFGPEPEPEAEPPADALDPTTRRQIRLALDHLRFRDLYDAFGLFRDAPLSVIAARADEERQRWMRKAQVTAEKTAWLEVVSLAQTHLGSAPARKRYDWTLVLEAEERFDQTAAFALRGLPRLDSGTRSVLIDEAGALGIARKRAERLIQRACRRAGLVEKAASATAGDSGVVPGLAATGDLKTVRCRNCAGVAELSPVARRAASARCKHCGASLKWSCPVCRRSNWVDEARCACGFRQVLREAVALHFNAAQDAFRARDLAAARRHLERVRAYAPRHPGARNGMLKVQERAAEIEGLRSDFAMAEAGGRMVSALMVIRAWRKLVAPGDPTIREARARVVDRIRRAERLATSARKVERTDPPRARKLYRESLNLAADLPSALDGLKRCPPDPPTELDARALGDRVRLSWSPPAPDELGPLTFVVLRKRGELPKHPGDGTRIAEISSAEFDDRRVEPGETVSYAVLSKRGPAESLAAVAAGPVLFLPDVREFRADPRETEVALTWEPPPGAVEVRVVRNRDVAPKNPRDGDRVPAMIDQAVDRDVEPGRVYHYGVFAIHQTADGRRFPSPGLTIAAGPRPAVAPPAAPRISLGPLGRVRLDWTEPARGTVRILWTATPSPFPPGATVAESEIDALGGRWLAAIAPDRAEDDAPPAAGGHYTPFLSVGGGLIAGRSVGMSLAADPTGLRAVRLGALPGEAGGGRVQLRWGWPPGAFAARVLARLGAPPIGPNDVKALAFTVSRTDYDRAGSWILTLPPPAPGLADEPVHVNGDVQAQRPTDWRVRVYGVADADGATHLSPGIEPTAETIVPGPHPEITIDYQLKRPWIPGRPWTLALRTEPPGEAIPPLVVVANARAVPLSAEDGEVVARVPAARDGSTHPIPADPRLQTPGVRAFVDPAGDPDLLPPVRLRHPEAGGTRV